VRILLSEDEPMLAKMLAHMLEEAGYSAPRVVGDGNGVLAALDEGVAEHPDVMLLDLNMPGMDGIELMRHVAERNYKGKLMVVSGESPEILNATRDLAIAHGLNVIGALRKPIAMDTLVKMMGRAAEDDAHTRQARELNITVEDINAAIEAEDFIVYYQPKVHVESNSVVGVEALVRWQHAEMGLIPPNAFIPLAEATGTISPITDQVLRQAVTQGGKWLRAGTPLNIAINMSMDCLVRLDYPEFISDLVAEADFDPARITLEVTESRLMKDATTALEILSRLRMKGFGLSVDDFGTGYSSMEQLRVLPFNELKVDRAFVHGAHLDPKARAILEMSAGLGRKLGMEIVAEGVENNDDMDGVTSMKCDLVQGFMFAKPMPADEFTLWLREWNSKL